MNDGASGSTTKGRGGKQRSARVLSLSSLVPASSDAPDRVVAVGLSDSTTRHHGGIVLRSAAG